MSNELLVSVLTLIADKIAPSGSGINSSRDCSHVDCVLFETLINKLLVSVLTPIANKIAPREGVQRRHDPRKNDLRTSGFAELPPGPAKLVSQPQ